MDLRNQNSSKHIFSGKGPSKANKSESRFRFARVSRVITEIQSKNFDQLGAIEFTYFDSKGRGTDLNSGIADYIKSSNNKNTNFKSEKALPLFPFLKYYPVKNEIVIIISNPQINIGDEINYFYMSPLNLLNSSYNPDAIASLDVNNNGNIDLGNGLDENILSKVRNLILAPGDLALQGRFGNSIKLGNSNKITIGNTEYDTPYIGNINNPIIIIRNGQKEVESITPLFEDINEDDTSIYLTSGQLIPIKVSSNNLDSYNIEIKETISNKDISSYNLNDISQDSNPLVIQSDEFDIGEINLNQDTSPSVLGGAYPTSSVDYEDGDPIFTDIIDVIKENTSFPQDQYYGNGNIDSKDFNNNNPLKLVRVSADDFGKIPVNGKLQNRVIFSNVSQPFLLQEAALALIEMVKDFVDYNQKLGIPDPRIVFTSMYRTYSKQVEMKKQYGNGAATPGTSNHGFGISIDWTWYDNDGDIINSNKSNNIIAFRSPQYEWAFQNGPNYGWTNAPALRDGKGLEEFWHWEYWGKGISRIMKKYPTSIGGGVNYTWEYLNKIDNFKLNEKVINPTFYKTEREAKIKT